MTEPVRVEKNGPVTTVIIDRPGARNAVNGPTAAALHQAFDEFDRDDSAAVAVLWGDHGTFCAGADLKAFGTPEMNQTHRTGPGPMASPPGRMPPPGRRCGWRAGCWPRCAAPIPGWNCWA